jgi:uncharacterized damage-inducible protein DinB
METEANRIADELTREHEGDPWHGTPLMQLLAGVDHELAARRPADGVHTIWELVLHITAWKNEVRKRIGGAPAREPEEGDWPEAPASQTASAWRDALAALEGAQQELTRAVATLSDDVLFAPTRDPRNRETGEGVSGYVLLHGIVQHDVYHSGQIALVTKLLQA